MDTVLAFPCLLTKICLGARVPEILEIDGFLWTRTTIDLGLIRYINDPMSRMAKLCALTVSDAYESRGSDTIRALDIVHTPTDTGQSEPQSTDVSVPSPTLISTPRPSTSRSILSDYVLVSQLFLSEVMMRLSMVETKV